MRLILLLVVALIYSGSSYAQNLPLQSSAIQLGYSGELGFHPGLQLGYELVSKNWTKDKKKRASRQKSLIWQASYSQIWHPHTRTYSILEGGAYLRTLKASGWTRQWSLRLGFAYLENAGTTYVEQEDGSAEGFNFAGNGYAAFSLGYGWGYDFRVRQSLPFAVIVQPQVSLLFGYNHILLPLTRVELGLRYYLNSKQKS